MVCKYSYFRKGTRYLDQGRHPFKGMIFVCVSTLGEEKNTVGDYDECHKAKRIVNVLIYIDVTSTLFILPL